MNFPRKSLSNYGKLGVRIGEGSSGQVFECGPYAVKRLARDVDGLLDIECTREIVNLVRLQGVVGIIQAVDICVDSGEVYVVFPRMNGDLKDWMSFIRGNNKSITRFLTQIAEAVYELHRRGFAHLDLKPRNVFVNKSGDAVLGDLGSARYVARDVKMTGEATTLYWRAPEVFAHEGYGLPADIWSLGCLFADFYLRRSLMEVDETQYAIRLQEVLTQLPPELTACPIYPLLRRMLVRDPSERLNAEQVLAWVREFSFADPCEVPPTKPVTVHSPREDAIFFTNWNPSEDLRSIADKVTELCPALTSVDYCKRAEMFTSYLRIERRAGRGTELLKFLTRILEGGVNKDTAVLAVHLFDHVPDTVPHLLPILMEACYQVALDVMETDALRYPKFAANQIAGAVRQLLVNLDLQLPRITFYQRMKYEFQDQVAVLRTGAHLYGWLVPFTTMLTVYAPLEVINMTSAYIYLNANWLLPKRLEGYRVFVPVMKMILRNELGKIMEETGYEL